MSLIELKNLADIIVQYCGIDYTQNLSSLDMKIRKRLSELKVSCIGYMEYLQIQPSEWEVLIELITVNETYFFREENMLNEFQKQIASMYAKQKHKKLKIWCAACSTGEEPYTLAMMIHEMGMYKKDEVSIIASDINTSVLEKAKKGRYNKKSFSFRKMPQEGFYKYFVEDGDDYVVKSAIKEMVSFMQLNLLKDDYKKYIGKVDIIICRNVLIYFDRNTIETIANKFHSNLDEDGLLFLGHSETLSYVKHKYKTSYTENIFYYRKEEK